MNESYHLAVLIQATDDLNNLLKKHRISDTPRFDKLQEYDPAITAYLKIRGGKSSVKRYFSLVDSCYANLNQIKGKYNVKSIKKA